MSMTHSCSWVCRLSLRSGARVVVGLVAGGEGARCHLAKSLRLVFGGEEGEAGEECSDGLEDNEDRDEEEPRLVSVGHSWTPSDTAPAAVKLWDMRRRIPRAGDGRGEASVTMVMLMLFVQLEQSKRDDGCSCTDPRCIRRYSG